MSSDTPKWNDVAERLRRAMGLCPPTPNEADQAIANADEVPMSEDEVRDIVSEVTKGKAQNHSFHPDHSWTEGIDTNAVNDDMLVMNRNPGDEDDEVDKMVEELRREALEDDEEPNEQA